jgi:hypothetical protein
MLELQNRCRHVGDAGEDRWITEYFFVVHRNLSFKGALE